MDHDETSVLVGCNAPTKTTRFKPTPMNTVTVMLTNFQLTKRPKFSHGRRQYGRQHQYAKIQYVYLSLVFTRVLGCPWSGCNKVLTLRPHIGCGKGGIF